MRVAVLIKTQHMEEVVLGVDQVILALVLQIHRAVMELHLVMQMCRETVLYFQTQVEMVLCVRHNQNVHTIQEVVRVQERTLFLVMEITQHILVREHTIQETAREHLVQVAREQYCVRGTDQVERVQQKLGVLG